MVQNIKNLPFNGNYSNMSRPIRELMITRVSIRMCMHMEGSQKVDVSQKRSSKFVAIQIQQSLKRCRVKTGGCTCDVPESRITDRHLRIIDVRC